MERFEPEAPKSAYSLLNATRVDAFCVWLSARFASTTACLHVGAQVEFVNFLLGHHLFSAVHHQLTQCRRSLVTFEKKLEPANAARLRQHDKQWMAERNMWMKVSSHFLLTIISASSMLMGFLNSLARRISAPEGRNTSVSSQPRPP